MAFKKGNIPWNKNKLCPNLGYWKNKKKLPMSEETKIKISKANKGKKRPDLAERNRTHIRRGFHHTEETKEKIRKAHLRENHPNWQGGTTVYPQIAFEKYGKICQRCGNTSNIVVHHKDENRRNNKIENLEVLCKNCHTKHHKMDKNFKGNNRWTKQKDI